MRELNKYILLLFMSFLLIFSRNNLHAQQPAFQIIKGLPTNEVYDLLIDSKGLLWIAHDQGLSRYDGKTFKHFTNPQQSGRAVTGLVEDKYGRVWCYNFNAQIFWVKNDVMHLLKDFDPSTEIYYPRITICNNELIAGCMKGLFIYDLETNKSRLLPTTYHVRSVSAVKDQVVAIVLDGCYIYSKGHAMVKKLWKDIAPELYGTALILENTAKDDTVFAIKGPANWYYRFIVDRDSIRVLGGREMDSYINTINNNSNERWVHTKTKSYNLTTGQQINGYNITDIVTDKEGNRWFSSLKTGLMMLPSHGIGMNKLDIPLRKGDYIRTTAMMGNKIIYGTQGGDVFTYDKIARKSKIIFSEKGSGAIEHLYIYDSNKIVICPSVGLYLLNLQIGKAKEVLFDMPVKDVNFTKDYTAISTSRGLILMPALNKDIMDSTWIGKAKQEYKGFTNYYPDIHALFWNKERCRAAVFSPLDKSIFASYRSGLYQVGAGQYPKPLTYRGETIKASTLVAANNKIFIGTATDDLLVYDRKGMHALFADEVKNTGSILQLTAVGGQLWVITTYGIKTIDVETEKVTGYYEMPGISPASIMDVEKLGNSVLVTLPDAVCKMSMSGYGQLPHPTINLAYVTVNGADTLNSSQRVLKNEESDLRFYLSTPWYSNNKAIQIAYRLIGNTDTSWQYVLPSDDPIFYASLPPGEYRFEARAFHLLSNYDSDLVAFSFSIGKPWWQSFLFLVLVILLVATLVAYIGRNYYQERLKRQQRYYENELAVEKERQKISADIHDELGGTLSGIRLMAEMTERKYEEQAAIQTELRDIHSSVSSLTQKLREVIWSLSNENNLLESLLDYLLRRGREMFVNSPISFNSKLPEYIPSVQIKGEKRRYIYLAVKETLRSILKHSDVTWVDLRFVINGDELNIRITANGKWMENDKEISTYSLKNIQIKMDGINGKVDVVAIEGIAVVFIIPI